MKADRLIYQERKTFPVPTSKMVILETITRLEKEKSELQKKYVELQKAHASSDDLDNVSAAINLLAVKIHNHEKLKR